MTIVKMVPAAPGELVADAVKRTLAALKLGNEDAAAAKLALEYADNIDRSGLDGLEKLGPKLLMCLDSLGGTPMGRAKARNVPQAAGARPGRLAEIRAASNR